jgi:hypothetical protein
MSEKHAVTIFRMTADEDILRYTGTHLTVLHAVLSIPPYESHYETQQIKTVLPHPKLHNYNTEYQQRSLPLHFK